MTSCCLCAKVINKFRGILICVIFRQRDMQELYMLFGIFTGEMGLYSRSDLHTQRKKLSTP
jgi:hypothetical protein